MTIFSKFYKKEKMLSRTLEIDETLYEKLNYLSKNVYDASINKLVNASIEELIDSENIKFYKSTRNSYISRSFLIRESFLEKLYILKKKYRISIYLLVNIAIKNAIDEWEETTNEKEFEEYEKRKCER
ncbi:MAG: hypothetical protein HFJ17_04630 [Clostridia bacterium]|nr:hypothetical protein [Clostridia bacterium]